MAEITPFPENFREMDEAKPNSLHWKILFISGMGFFTDAYNLFIIGVVMSILKPLWNGGKVGGGLVECACVPACRPHVRRVARQEPRPAVLGKQVF